MRKVNATRGTPSRSSLPAAKSRGFSAGGLSASQIALPYDVSSQVTKEYPAPQLRRPSAQWRAGQQFDRLDLQVMGLEAGDPVDGGEKILEAFAGQSGDQVGSNVLRGQAASGRQVFHLRHRLPHQQIKQVRGGELVRAIRTVGKGESLLDPAVTNAVLERLRKGKHLLKDERLARLSPQEERILSLVADGKTNREIGEELGLAEKTVKNYVSSILSKLEVARRAEAAAYLARHTTTPGTQG